MAEYLLKGGKMLAKTCNTCSSPLFEYKGNTFCAVCLENQEQENEATVTAAIQSPQKKADDSSRKLDVPGNMRCCDMDSPLQAEFDLTIRNLLSQVRDEGDSRRALELMQAVQAGAEAWARISYR
ncbi:MAG TPA: Sjogren's syndrome/scleroderma autoantigen 1 family protein [Methanospirillum sp.]|nr:Sjogren's syndrome/scleroderma autoantigen 1 family protein [Methanospirillum sp.]